ncbi:MAG TPA: Rid family detoxifying hydrolase [Pseudomonadales bacterium]|jgi:reactive intermediate/imine deaminase|nr:Rid family detoxifying hydrolase [Pseudomonadales bacterium]
MSESRSVIATPTAPAAIGTYSQAVGVGNTVYLSGQIALDPATTQLIAPDIDAQIHQVFKNLRAVAIAGGGGVEHFVKLTVYVTSMTFFPRVNEIMAQYFTKPYPARAAVGVAELPRGALVEIDAVMVLPAGK